MKTIFVALLISGVTALSTHGESFTGTATSSFTSSNVFQTGAGKPVMANTISFTAQTVWAGGKTSTNKGTCANWSTPPGSIFDANGVCNYTDTNGDTGSILIGCDFSNKDMTEGDCWGGLSSSSGPHAQKRGTISWHFKPGADGKSGTSTTVGQWND